VRTAVYPPAVSIPAMRLAICRACVGAPDPHCWSCEGQRLVIVGDEDEADFLLHLDAADLRIGLRLDPTPRFLAWLDEVTPL